MTARRTLTRRIVTPVLLAAGVALGVLGTAGGASAAPVVAAAHVTVHTGSPNGSSLNVVSPNGSSLN